MVSGLPVICMALPATIFAQEAPAKASSRRNSNGQVNLLNNEIGKEKEETILIDSQSKSEVPFVTHNGERELSSGAN
jgi:hypothetical protein